MNRLWTFGCSFTAEYNLIDGIHAPYENSYDKFKKFRGGTLPLVWPEILGKKLNYQTMNCAVGGSSNYSIYTQFLNIVDLIKKDDILIFGWTSILRHTAVNLRLNVFSDILPSHTNYEETGYSTQTLEEIVINRSNPLWSVEVMNWIKLINLFCDKINAESYHWTSDETIFNKNTKDINQKNFIVVDDEVYNKHHMLGYINAILNQSGIPSTIIQETNGEVEDLHLGENGHKLQSDLFLEHIKNHTKINLNKNE